MKLGQIEPARANAAIYGLSTFLGSRKIAEDLSDRRRVEEMEGRVRELIEQIAVNRLRGTGGTNETSIEAPSSA